MDNILIIITSEHDIPIAEGIAADLAEYKVYFFDPTLVDVIRKSSLRNTELIIWNDCPEHGAQETLAHERARTLERELENGMRPHLPGISIKGWQHLNLYYFFMSYHWYSGLWRDMAKKLSEGKPYVFLCDNPSNFYWPSFMPALLLLQQLRTLDIPFSALTYGKRPDESDVLMNLCDDNADQVRYDLLTHLPTCFYDLGYVNAELQASGKTNIDIAPKYWSVELQSTKTINLIRLREQQSLSGGWPTLDAAAAQLEQALDILLTPFIITPSYRVRQVQHLSNLYQCQIVSWHLLERYFQHVRPGKILLTDHDAGFHGPLISFAERHHIPVLQIPHSKVSLNVDFGYDNIMVLTHPIQGAPPVNGNQQRLIHVNLTYPETFSGRSTMPQPIKCVGLLLNGLALNGIQCTDFSSYIDGISQIDQWCKRRGLELLIRARPGQTLDELLHSAIGIERANLQAVVAESLQHFAQRTDLCLMYDAPTSGVIEFLRTGVPILNPIPAPLSKAETLTANSRVMPRASVEATLEMLDGFVDDNNTFHVFGCDQFAAYVNLFTQSYALRRLL